MKNSIFIIAAFIISPIIFTNCDKIAQNRERNETLMIEANREMGISRSEVAAEVRTFRVEMAGKIMENNRSIADIKRGINKDGISAGVAEARIAAFQSENRELKRTIDNYSDLSRHNWDEFKKEFTEDMADLGNSLTTFFEYSDAAK